MRNFVCLALFSAGLFAGCSQATLKEPPPGAGPGDEPGTDDGGSGADDGGSTGDATSDGGMAEAGGGGDSGLAYTSQVKIIVEPSDHGQALLSAIQGAKTSVHMTMYLLSNSDIVSALIAQKNAGHEVKVILNQNFPMGQGSNASTFSQLKGAGVDVVYAPSTYTYTHEKCVIVDGASAWIMTMNATQSSPTDNREYLAVDGDPADVAAAETVFEADFGNTAVGGAGKLVLAPVNARPKLVGLLGTATKTVDVEGEELSDTAIVNAIVAKADAGVAVRVVLAGSGSPAQQQAINLLKNHKVPVVALANPYVHAKALVVDHAHAYVGSENFTAASLGYNRELGVLVDNATEVAKVTSTIDADFAGGSPL